MNDARQKQRGAILTQAQAALAQVALGMQKALHTGPCMQGFGCCRAIYYNSKGKEINLFWQVIPESKFLLIGMPFNQGLRRLSRISRSNTMSSGVAGGASGGAARLRRLICLIMMKMMKARIRKFSAMVMKLP